jgi:hypothetical protein
MARLGGWRTVDTTAATIGRVHGRRGQRRFGECKAVEWGHVRSGDEFVLRCLVRERPGHTTALANGAAHHA